jgi:hypothetical protein
VELIYGFLIGIGITASVFTLTTLTWVIPAVGEFLYEFYRWRRQLAKIREAYSYNFMCSELVNWDEMIEDMRYANYLRESGFKEIGFRTRK